MAKGIPPRYADARHHLRHWPGWNRGKTYLAMAMAVSALKQEKVNRIILTRPAVEAGEALGFLPGDLQEKILPYLRPLYDAFTICLRWTRSEYMDRGVIEIAPLAYMRGRTLSQAFVILDEAQNTTTEQMFMFLTRLGQRFKCVVTGDRTQIDLPRNKRSGLDRGRRSARKGRGHRISLFRRDRRGSSSARPGHCPRLQGTSRIAGGAILGFSLPFNIYVELSPTPPVDRKGHGLRQDPANGRRNQVCRRPGVRWPIRIDSRRFCRRLGGP